MTDAYILSCARDGTHLSGSYTIEAAHEASLPGVECEHCGVWAVTGAQYPTLRDPKLFNILNEVATTVVSRQEFIRIRNAIRSTLADDIRCVPPGSSFGRLIGRVIGSAPAVAWRDPWTLLLSKAVLDQFGSYDIYFARELTELGGLEQFFEIEARPLVSVARNHDVKPCALCGRFSFAVPDDLSLCARSFDDELPIQRVLELPTIMIVNKKVAKVIELLAPPDMELAPVPLR